MSPNPLYTSPWPVQTPPPTDNPPPRPKRKRQHTREINQVDIPFKSLKLRQLYDPDAVEAAKAQCMWRSGNNVISCFPDASIVVPQNTWAAFVWNSRRPELTQTNRVNIYLFRGDSREQVLSFKDQMNPTAEAGWVTALANDSWWGERGKAWNGHNITYPYYWVITRSDKTLDGSEVPQTIFSAVQTTYADSVMSSMSVSAASVSSAAAAASRSMNSRPSASGLQSGAGSSSLPHWAIVIIAILAFLALVSMCLVLFILLARLRAYKRSRNRHSSSSDSPMLENVERSHSSPVAATAGPTLAQQPPSSVSQHPHAAEPGDGASTVSGSMVETGPISGADAAIMADAFRKALRKPDFAGQAPVEEGDGQSEEEEMISKELAAEGRDIRSVGSSRGVKVEQTGDRGAS